MRTVYLVAVYLHLLASAIWLGGMLFIVLVLVPLLRQPDMRAQSAAIFARTGRRYRAVGWATLATLVGTGVVQAAYRAGGMSALGDPEWWHSPFGSLLGLKIHLVIVVLVLSGVHDFWIGPRASALWSAEPDAARTRAWRAAASWVGRANLVLGLLIVAIAVVLVRGP